LVFLAFSGRRAAAFAVTGKESVRKFNKEVRKRRPTLFSGSNQRILDTGVKTGDARSERREFKSGVFGDEILDG